MKMDVKRLESAMPFLACPKDGGRLRIGSRPFSGCEVLCESCQESYPMRKGVLCFYDGRAPRPYMGFARTLRNAIVLAEASDGKGLVCELSSFGQGLLEFSASRKDAMFELSRLIQQALPRISDDEKKALLLQAFNAARYDLEVYRGTYVLPKETLSSLGTLPPGAVAEGACASGENVVRTRTAILQNGANPPVFLGFDLSLNLASLAQQRFGQVPGVLFVQASMLFPPLAQRSFAMFSALNVWDRLPNPKAAAERAGTALAPGGFAIFGNCAPLQFESPGSGTVYVPEPARTTLEGAIELAGCTTISSLSDLWNVRTILDGKERLPMEVRIGRKR